MHSVYANVLSQIYFVWCEEWALLRQQTVEVEGTTASLQLTVANQAGLLVSRGAVRWRLAVFWQCWWLPRRQPGAARAGHRSPAGGPADPPAPAHRLCA